MIAFRDVSTTADAPDAPSALSDGGTDLGRAPSRPVRGATLGVSLVLAAALVATAFTTHGGVDETVASSGNSWTEIVITLVGGTTVAAGLAVGRRRGRAGLVPVLALAALTALEAISIAWSVLPDDSWMGSRSPRP